MEQDAVMDEMLQKKLDLALQMHTKNINDSMKALHEKVDNLSTELAELKNKVRYGEIEPASAPAPVPKQEEQKTVQAAASAEKKEPEQKHPTNDVDFDASIEKHFYCGK